MSCPNDDNSILYIRFLGFSILFTLRNRCARKYLHYRFHHNLIPDCDRLYTDFFLLVKVKTQHIAFILVIIIQIIHKLLFAALVFVVIGMLPSLAPMLGITVSFAPPSWIAIVAAALAFDGGWRSY